MSVLPLGSKIVACGRVGVAGQLSAHYARTDTCRGFRPRARRDICFPDGRISAFRCRCLCDYSGAQPPHPLAGATDRFDSDCHHRCGLSLGLTSPVGAVGIAAATVRVNDRCRPVHFWWSGKLMPEALPRAASWPTSVQIGPHDAHLVERSEPPHWRAVVVLPRFLQRVAGAIRGQA